MFQHRVAFCGFVFPGSWDVSTSCSIVWFGFSWPVGCFNSVSLCGFVFCRSCRVDRAPFLYDLLVVQSRFTDTRRGPTARALDSGLF